MGGPCTKAASMSFDMDLNTQQLRLIVCTLMGILSNGRCYSTEPK